MMATMTQDARISTRIDADLKTEGEAILSQLGIKPSQAISMFYTQIVRQRGMPLELKIPNDETIAAFGEDLSDAKRYTNIDQMFADMDNEVAE